MRYLLSLALVIFFTGCFGSSKPEPVSYPNWYFNPPKSDSMYLYGKGEGYSEKEAVDAGLNRIASTLSVSVESSFESQKNIYQVGGQEEYTRNVSNNIKSNVAKITFNNYELFNMAKVGDKIVVVVKVDREKLFAGKKKEYDSSKRKISDLYKLSKNKSIIEKLNKLKEVNKASNKAVSLAFLLNTLKDNYKIESDLKTFEGYKKEERSVRSSIKFYIKADRNSKLLAEPIRVALNKQGMKVINNFSKNKNVVQIFLKGRDKKAKAMGRKIIKTTLNITLKTNRGNVLSSNKLTLVGKSSFDYGQAKESVSKNLAKQINKDGVMTIIGLER
ncbi:MAG: LPP20 family lipoprotein [Campylobacterales bacterium]|nr:LPP20 family lipoprotein [Campylobacterales bacterium]